MVSNLLTFIEVIVFRIAIIGILLICVQACSDQTAVKEETKPLVVQLTEVKQSNLNQSYEFPATVSAVKDVELKFEVSGRLIFENLVEGSAVTKGQVLAQIDQAPFKRKVEETRTRLVDAKRMLKRVTEMYDKKVASQREMDDAESGFKLAQIALDNALQDLSYCTIKAPFDAIIGERLIENNSYVRAGDTIAALQDRSQLYFSFEVPERIMTANAGNRNVKATAYIIGQEDKVFDIHYVEHRTTPDPISQTYGLTFGIKGETTNLFYPGSRATVKIEKLSGDDSALIIPLKSLVGNKDSGFHVWRFNPDNNQLEKVAVKVTQLVGDHVVIDNGVFPGDKIVSAAVTQMREGLVVREYKAEF